MGLFRRFRDWKNLGRKGKRQPAAAPGIPPGDFRLWQRRRAQRSAERGETLGEELLYSDRQGWRKEELSKRRPLQRVSQFRIMLEICPAPDGGKWTALEMEQATNGKVHPAFFFALQDGLTSSVSGEQMDSIAKAMDLPPELWHRQLWWWEKVYEDWKNGVGVEGKLQDRGYDPMKPYRLLDDWGRDLSWIPTGSIGDFTLDEAAQLLQISEEEVLEMIESGQLEVEQGGNGESLVSGYSVREKL